MLGGFLSAGELIAAISSFSTLAVAIVVWRSNNGHASRAHLVAERGSLMEEQKIRLALLDRRIVAIEKIRETTFAYYAMGEVRQEDISRAAEALQIADLVFDVDVRAAIRDFVRTLTDWRRLERQMAIYAKREDLAARYCSIVDERFELETKMLEGFDPLLEKLSAASRVTLVQPLQSFAITLEAGLSRIYGR